MATVNRFDETVSQHNPKNVAPNLFNRHLSVYSFVYRSCTLMVIIMKRIASGFAVSGWLALAPSAIAQDAVLAEAAAMCETFQTNIDNPNEPRDTDSQLEISDEQRAFKRIAVRMMIDIMTIAQENPNLVYTEENLDASSFWGAGTTDNAAFNAGVWYAQTSGYAGYLVSESLTPIERLDQRRRAQSARLLSAEYSCAEILTLDQ